MQLVYKNMILPFIEYGDVLLSACTYEKKTQATSTTKQRAMMSQSKKLLKIKCPKTEKFKKSLAYRGPNKWNNLPVHLHNLPIRNMVKLQIRAELNGAVTKATADEICPTTYVDSEQHRVNKKLMNISKLPMRFLLPTLCEIIIIMVLEAWLLSCIYFRFRFRFRMYIVSKAL